jgi:sulfofructosephosphate aldolase
MTTLDALARPSGTFLMVAMDQRESLRTMLAGPVQGPVPDEALTRFKVAVARELGPYASGLLIDRDYGDAVLRERMLPPGCGPILAVDVLEQPPGGIVEDTSLDPEPDPDGAVALKLLVLWRDDERRAERVELSRRFVELSARLGLLSVLEGVVRVPDEDFDDAIVEAGRELAAVGPSLYKAQVPLHGRGDPEEITRRCRELDAVLEVPWVVLSQGVELADFPRAVEAACRGGASGMLAGRAIWSDVVGAGDPTELLRERSVPRLQELAEIVDREGRPWREKS